MTEKETVTVPIVSNWFANKRKDLKKLYKEGDFNYDIQLGTFAIDIVKVLTMDIVEYNSRTLSISRTADKIFMLSNRFQN